MATARQRNTRLFAIGQNAAYLTSRNRIIALSNILVEQCRMLDFSWVIFLSSLNIVHHFFPFLSFFFLSLRVSSFLIPTHIYCSNTLITPCLFFITANYKAMNYHYERPFKPTSRLHDQFVSISGEVMPKETSVPMPTMQFFTGKTNLSLVNDVGLPKPKWGQFNPGYYGDPYQHLHLPPLKLGGKKYHCNEYISYTGAH